MGRVFSYQELAEYRVPGSDSFALAREVFTSEVEMAIGNGVVDGAFIYGSTALGTANRRSDFDALIALSDNSPAAYKAGRDIVAAVRLETEGLVPVPAITCSKANLIQGRHEMDRFFGQHLSSPERVVIGNDPASYIRYPATEGSTILANYLHHKRRRLSDSYNEGPALVPSEDRGLQRMLELPAAVGRKFLQAMAEAGSIEAPQRTADKQPLLQSAREVLVLLGIAAPFDDLAGLDQAYTSLMTDVLIGGCNQRAYEGFMFDLHQDFVKAIRWLDQVEDKCLPSLPAL